MFDICKLGFLAEIWRKRGLKGCPSATLRMTGLKKEVERVERVEMFKV